MDRAALVNPDGPRVRVFMFDLDCCRAAQNGDVPLASYLVNHRARTDIRSFKGLLPIDLAKRNQSGDDLRDILEAASDSQPLSSGQSFNSETSEASSTASSQRAEKKRKEKKAQKRSQLGRESALNLDVDPNLLGLPEQPWASTSAAPHSPSLVSRTLCIGLNVTVLILTQKAIASDHQPEFDFNHCQPSQMLVFGMEDLPLIFHRVITSMQPVRSLIQRVLPANVLFLCTRFAVHWSDSDLLDELLLGSIEAIEDVIQGGSDDLATCSFWLNNAVLLLYFLRIDRSTCDATKEYQLHWVELINELYVYVIRDIERRIDKILEPALLDFGELGEDVRFEGEWSFVKAFTSASNKSQRYVSASSTIAGSSTPTPTRTSIISLFGNAGDSAVSRTPSPSKKGNPSRPSSAQQTPNNNDHLPPETPSPKDISSLLTSALFILQLYETHPSIIVQAFSQILYWLSSELTNRILAHRKYLCRSKALQIRLNISTLEDWARLNGLPAKLVNSHFRPLGQLLQWLQCLSSEDTLDGLVGTIMNLKDLNPLQLRKVVKEYRHEVDEPHMSEECQQYLSQLERDWDRQRVSRSAQLAREDQLEDEESEDVAENGDHSIITKKVDDFGGDDSQTPGERRRIKRMEEHIDAVFDSPQKHHLFQPPPRAECFGELFDSRYMVMSCPFLEWVHLLTFRSAAFRVTQ